ncbi:MAG: hypothetical protein FWE32_02380 [Oscillospiraceae bacterium]|nr:hypothetical protein [Oscillospiraceae bacterium]
MLSAIHHGRHIIRRATLADVAFIMDFLGTYWENGCLLSRDRAYFEYEFVVDGVVNLVVAEHKENGTIDATQGYIQCSKSVPHDGFYVIWACKPQSGTSFLGVTMNKNMLSLTGARKLFGVGITDKGRKVASRYGDTDRIQKLSHYYRLAQRNEYTIAEIVTPRHEESITVPGRKLIPIPTIHKLKEWYDFQSLPDVSMYKDLWYIEHRYYNHPYYKFNIWGIEESPGVISGLLVGRMVNHNGSACLRIMDFFGHENLLAGIGAELDLIMMSVGLEYTDFYCAGIPHDSMKNAGFALRDEYDKNIIPNHFEPYERRNVDILYSGGGARAYKGDGDQGRPKRLRLGHEWQI